MKQEMELTQFGVSELSPAGLSGIHGGSLLPNWLSAVAKKFTPVAIGAYIIDNWADVKKGFSEGWNFE